MGVEDNLRRSFLGNDGLLDRLYVPARNNSPNCEGYEGVSKVKREADTYPDAN